MPAIAIRRIDDPRTARHGDPRAVPYRGWVPNQTSTMALRPSAAPSPERTTRRPQERRPAVYRGAKLGNLLRM